jgi:hypothetical protein
VVALGLVPSRASRSDRASAAAPLSHGRPARPVVTAPGQQQDGHKSKGAGQKRETSLARQHLLILPWHVTPATRSPGWRRRSSRAADRRTTCQTRQVASSFVCCVDHDRGRDSAGEAQAECVRPTYAKRLPRRRWPPPMPPVADAAASPSSPLRRSQAPTAQRAPSSAGTRRLQPSGAPPSIPPPLSPLPPSPADSSPFPPPASGRLEKEPLALGTGSETLARMRKSG